MPELMGDWPERALDMIERLEAERDSLLAAWRVAKAQRDRYREMIRLDLWAALAGYDAQYGAHPLAEQHPSLPAGCVQRVEAVVQAARALVDATNQKQNEEA